MESFRHGVQRLRESLFVLPAGMIVLWVAMGAVARYLDREVSAVGEFPLLISVSPSGGRSIAAVVAGATITVAAIVFSMTALSSQIAASQYSPRAVAGFFENRFQQVVIGLVVGTFAYSLLVVTSLGGVADSVDTSSRSLSVTVMVVLGIASGIAIVAYIDHSLRRMRIDAVVMRISEATVEAIERDHRRVRATAGDEGRRQPEGRSRPIRARRMGRVRFIDGPRLARALPPETLARVEVRVGEFVASRDLVATVWLASESDLDRSNVAVRRAIHMGRTRSIDRDPAFGIRQLVDIALRALSPGINDPTTAVDVVQHLKVPLRGLLTAPQPVRVFTGPDSQRVFLPEAPSRSDHVHAAFSEIRLGAATQPGVLRSLLEVIGDLLIELEELDLMGRGVALLEEADLVLRAARGAGFPESDLARIIAAADRLGIYGSRDDDVSPPKRTTP